MRLLVGYKQFEMPSVRARNGKRRRLTYIILYRRNKDMLEQNDLQIFREMLKEELQGVKEELNSTKKEMKKGFDKINERFAIVDERLGTVDKRLDGVEKRLGGVEERLNIVETEVKELHQMDSTIFSELERVHMVLLDKTGALEKKIG